MLNDQQLADLPVFPLPNMVMFPGSVVPLHIFEPRYRAMVQWCLAHDSPFAVAMIAPGAEGAQLADPDVVSICGVGRIDRHLKLPDGRYNLVLQAQTRVHLEKELPQRDGFRRFEVRELQDLPADPQVLGGHMATIKVLCDGLATTIPSLGFMLAELLRRDLPPGQVADQLVDFTTLEPSDKQKVLEERDPAARLKQVEDMLAEILANTHRGQDHGHGCCPD